MNKLALVVVAGAALLGGAGVASAQGVQFGIGPGGAGVRVDDGYRGDRDWRRDREFRRSRNQVIVVQPDRDRRRDWDGRRNQYYEDRY